MRIVIIEDEKYTSQDLIQCIKEVRITFAVIATLTTVKDSIAFFKKETDYNLIFSDIQLGDGLSFEIFNKISVNAPVIFCTAYDNYAIDAFKANGIDYILKPINKKSITSAIEKYERFVNPADGLNESIVHLLDMYKSKAETKKTRSVLIHYKDKIIPVRMEEVALFYIENEHCRILNFEGKQFIINETLDEIEDLCGTDFFRANRQFIVNRKAVKELVQYFARKHLLKLSVPFEEKIIVSKEKTPALLKWLEEF